MKTMKSTLALLLAGVILGAAGIAQARDKSEGRMRCIGGGVKIFVPAGMTREQAAAAAEITRTSSGERSSISGKNMRCIGHGVKVPVSNLSSDRTLSNSGSGKRVRCIGQGVKVPISSLDTDRAGGNSGKGMRCIGHGVKVPK